MSTQTRTPGSINQHDSMQKNAPLPQPDRFQSTQDEEEDPQHYIDMLEELQVQCEREGRYVEAEMAKNKLVVLRKQLEGHRKDEIRSRHINEKRQLEQEHIEEFKEFNVFWDQRMAEFNEKAATIEEQTILKHQAEMAKFIEELDMSLPNRPKDSPELLNLRKIQQSLAKKKEYIEAHKVQQRCMKLEKEELERWLPSRDKKILNQKAQLEQKQANELNALRKRIITGQDEQRKARSLELERLLQKYQNIRKELEQQQQLELSRISASKAVMNSTGSMFRPQGSRMGRSNYEAGSPAYGKR